MQPCSIQSTRRSVELDGGRMQFKRMSVSFAGVIVVGGLMTAACESSKMPTTPTAAAGPVESMAAMDHSAMPMAGNADGEIYSAELQPLYAGVGYRDVKGHAKFQIVNGMFVAMDEATGTQPGMIHPQHIHAAAQCPPAS